MYGPSFFTGRLITRFGAPRVVDVGFVLTAASAVVGLLGIDVAHFWLTLILLGVGWNFSFIGAYTLVLQCHRPEERPRSKWDTSLLCFGAWPPDLYTSASLRTSQGRSRTHSARVGKVC